MNISPASLLPLGPPALPLGPPEVPRSVMLPASLKRWNALPGQTVSPESQNDEELKLMALRGRYWSLLRRQQLLDAVESDTLATDVPATTI